MNHIENFLCFEFKQFIPFSILSSVDICGMKWGSAEVLFVTSSSESLSLGYFTPTVSTFSIWLAGLDY